MSTWRDLDAYVRAHGLPVGSDRPGLTKPATNTGHASGSLHYAGRARDYGEGLPDPWPQMAAIARLFEPLAQGEDHLIEELFYAPTGTWWDNGERRNVGGHTTHVHVAIRDGAVLTRRRRDDDDL